MEKHVFELTDETKEYAQELSSKVGKSCALEQFIASLEFVLNTDESFTIADLQRYLKCGFGTACKVIDALLALCVIEIIEESPRKYKRSA